MAYRGGFEVPRRPAVTVRCRRAYSRLPVPPVRPIDIWFAMVRQGIWNSRRERMMTRAARSRPPMLAVTPKASFAPMQAVCVIEQTLGVNIHFL